MIKFKSHLEKVATWPCYYPLSIDEQTALRYVVKAFDLRRSITHTDGSAAWWTSNVQGYVDDPTPPDYEIIERCFPQYEGQWTKIVIGATATNVYADDVLIFSVSGSGRASYDESNFYRGVNAARLVKYLTGVTLSVGQIGTQTHAHTPLVIERGAASGEWTTHEDEAAPVVHRPS